MPPGEPPKASFYDDSGNYIGGSTMKDSQADHTSCEARPVGYSWDMTNKTINQSFSDSDYNIDSGSFSGNRILFTLHPNYTPPSNWVEIVESDEDVGVTVDSGISNSLCPGDTAEVEFTLEPKTITGSFSGTLSVTNQISGESQQEDISISSSKTFTKSVTVPDGASVGEQDVIKVDVQ